LVLYDHLASRALLDFAPPHADRIYVGKKRADHAVSQQEIVSLMIEHARKGRNVVRLKGGDPFIFGRGGEEVEALADANIPYEVVPGVTAPLGIAAYTGVPLTHREHTSIVTFVTGHDVASVDWKSAGRSETLVIFMGLHHVAEIMHELLEAGRDPNTPAMAVRWGTRADQHTVTGSIASLPGVIAAEHLLPPATIIVGDVVSLRDKLNWFEKLPLFGQRIVVTRARNQASEVSAKLRALGAEPIEIATIGLEPLDDYSAADAAIDRLSTYQWIVFTSANAVEFFMDRLFHSPHDLRDLRARICAIGPATAAVLGALHLKVDLMPESSVAEGLVGAFENYDMRGARVLLPRAASAREVLPEALRARGAIVDVVDVYRNVVPSESTGLAREVFSREQRPDWIIFSSSSTVKNLLAMTPADSLHGIKIASIGPITTKTVRMHGLEVNVEPEEASIDAVIAAIVESARGATGR
jgi:uroporphyrinogen III methyltransferase/synthase